MLRTFLQWDSSRQHSNKIPIAGPAAAAQPTLESSVQTADRENRHQQALGSVNAEQPTPESSVQTADSKSLQKRSAGPAAADLSTKENFAQNAALPDPQALPFIAATNADGSLLIQTIPRNSVRSAAILLTNKIRHNQFQISNRRPRGKSLSVYYNAGNKHKGTLIPKSKCLF